MKVIFTSFDKHVLFNIYLTVNLTILIQPHSRASLCSRKSLPWRNDVTNKPTNYPSFLLKERMLRLWTGWSFKTTRESKSLCTTFPQSVLLINKWPWKLFPTFLNSNHLLFSSMFLSIHPFLRNHFYSISCVIIIKSNSDSSKRLCSHLFWTFGLF